MRQLRFLKLFPYDPPPTLRFRSAERPLRGALNLASMLVTILSYAEDEHSARWHPRWMLATFVARDTHLTEMNPTISSNFAEKRLKTSTQLVAGLTITVTDVTSDVFGGNEFLVLKTQELGEAEGLAIGCFTKGRQGNYYNPDGTISEQRTMRYPQGTAVDAYKKVFNEVQALPESERTYGVLAERLRSVFNGKKIAITADNYVDRYGTERALRHFNFA